MALRKLAFNAPMRAALWSGQRALLSYSGGSKGMVKAAGTSGVTPAARELAGALGSDPVTTKFGDPSFWEGEYSSQVRVLAFLLSCCCVCVRFSFNFLI